MFGIVSGRGGEVKDHMGGDGDWALGKGIPRMSDIAARTCSADSRSQSASVSSGVVTLAFAPRDFVRDLPVVVDLARLEGRGAWTGLRTRLAPVATASSGSSVWVSGEDKGGSDSDGGKTW